MYKESIFKLKRNVSSKIKKKKKNINEEKKKKKNL